MSVGQQDDQILQHLELQRNKAAIISIQKPVISASTFRKTSLQPNEQVPYQIGNALTPRENKAVFRSRSRQRSKRGSTTHQPTFKIVTKPEPAANEAANEENGANQPVLMKRGSFTQHSSIILTEENILGHTISSRPGTTNMTTNFFQGRFRLKPPLKSNQLKVPPRIGFEHLNPANSKVFSLPDPNPKSNQNFKNFLSAADTTSNIRLVQSQVASNSHTITSARKDTERPAFRHDQVYQLVNEDFGVPRPPNVRTQIQLQSKQAVTFGDNEFMPLQQVNFQPFNVRQLNLVLAQKQRGSSTLSPEKSTRRSPVAIHQQENNSSALNPSRAKKRYRAGGFVAAREESALKQGIVKSVAEKLSSGF